MRKLPARYCEICDMIHEPPIHDLARCFPGRSGVVRFSPLPDLNDPAAWPSRDEMKAAADYWDAVLADKGDKPLS